MLTTTTTTLQRTSTSDITSTTKPKGMLRTGAAAGAVAALATTVIVVIAKSLDVPVAIENKPIPVAGFAQLTFVCALMGTGIAALLTRRSNKAAPCSSGSLRHSRCCRSCQTSPSIPTPRPASRSSQPTSSPRSSSSPYSPAGLPTTPSGRSTTTLNNSGWSPSRPTHSGPMRAVRPSVFGPPKSSTAPYALETASCMRFVGLRPIVEA
jgi:Family of unknown function (DUF6069)